MSKARTQSVPSPENDRRSEHPAEREPQPNEPLSGSKKVKNRNHSRQNNTNR